MFFPIVGTIIKKVLDVIDQIVPDKDLKEKLKAEIQLTIFTKEYDVIMKVIEAQKAAIIAEATGHSWLQRNWRPILMLMFAYIIAHNYILVPLLGITRVETPPQLFDIIKLGIGGYIVGRSVEKSINIYKNKNS